MGALCLFLNIDIQAQVSNGDTIWLSPENPFSKNGGEPCFYLYNGINGTEFKKLPLPKKKSWILHGDLVYDYTYRSLSNNIVQEEDIHRHMIRLNYRIEGAIPLQGTIAMSAGNSIYYPRLFSFSLNYNRQQWLNSIKDKRLQALETELPDVSGITNKADSIAFLNKGIQSYQQMMLSPDYHYKIQQGKETILNNALQKIEGRLSEQDSLKLLNRLLELLSSGNLKEKDSSFSRTPINGEILDLVRTALHLLKKDKYIIDSLQQQKSEIVKRYNSSKRMVSDSIRNVSAAINQAMKNSTQKGNGYIKEMLPDRNKKIARFLNTFEQIQIGRSEVNLSQLTVFNWPITGLNVTTAGKHTFEIAAGISNYRQRNFLFPQTNGTMKGQPTITGRYKLIANPLYELSYTVYMGSMMLNYQAVQNPKTIPVVGNGFQLNFLPFKNQKLEIEFVKSNVNEMRTLPGTNLKAKGEIFNFSIRDNEAFNIQYTGVFPGLKANIDGAYSKSGSSFLSLGIYPGEAVKESFRANLQKRFFENKINVRMGIRKNAFTYPYLQHLSANNILYQAMATVRLKNWPIVTLGYFPSTQLVAMPDSNIAEINFQTFISSASYQIIKPSFTHSFQLSGTFLQTKQLDTISATGIMNNFIGFNYNGNRGNKWHFEGMLMYNQLKGNTLVTYGVGSGIKLGKGWEQSFIIKYHNGSVVGNQWGYKVILRSMKFQFGQFSLEGERQMLPFYSQNKFVPVMMGHAVFMLKF